MMKQNGINPKTKKLYGKGGVFGNKYDSDMQVGIVVPAQLGLGGAQLVEQRQAWRAVDIEPGRHLKIADRVAALLVDRAIDRAGRKAELIQQCFDLGELGGGQRRGAAAGEMPDADRDQDGKGKDNGTAQKAHPGWTGIVSSIRSGAERIFIHIGAERIHGSKNTGGQSRAARPDLLFDQMWNRDRLTGLSHVAW